MDGSFFYGWGKWVYRYKALIIIGWLLIILSCLPFITDIISPFKSTGFIDNNSSSAKAEEYLEKNLPYYHNRLMILYHSEKPISQAALLAKIDDSLQDVKKFSLKHEIIYPDKNNNQLSSDKRTAYALILLKDNRSLHTDELMDLEALIHIPKNISVHFGGEPFFIDDVNKQTQKDLYKADLVATPVALITLILVFGSIIASLLPLFLGGGGALVILIILYITGHFITLSIFTLNIALLLGLCLSLDYALFIISRFRDELAGQPIEIALAKTLKTAGKAVFFSGLAVFISLSALLLFPVTILFSMGIGGLAAVFIAVAIATTLLPAILGLLGARINYFPVRLFKKGFYNFHFWRWLSTSVIKHPILNFIGILAILLFLGSPFLWVKFGLSDYRILPPHSEGREFFDQYKKSFNENELNPIVLIIKSPNKNILSKSSIGKIYDLGKKIEENPRVKNVSSIVTGKPKLSKNSYQMLYKEPEDISNKSLKKLLLTTSGPHFTTMMITSKYPPNSSETETLINQIRKITLGPEFVLQVTGVPVKNLDVLKKIEQLFPYAILWILVLTYLILLILLHSIFLPLKAILMNMISLCASYGVLVFVFQEGYFHQFLNFEPQGILDVSLLIIIFCALFGFSMDYEVFLLTRIRECFLRNKSNSLSIIYGIEHSSRLITSAAIIVIFICGSFMVADVLMVKAFGLGIAIAIFVDAFLVRSILVPATMALMRKWNWYLPKWIKRILPED